MAIFLWIVPHSAAYQVRKVKYPKVSQNTFVWHSRPALTLNGLHRSKWLYGSELEFSPVPANVANTDILSYPGLCILFIVCLVTALTMPIRHEWVPLIKASALFKRRNLANRVHSPNASLQNPAHPARRKAVGLLLYLNAIRERTVLSACPQQK